MTDLRTLLEASATIELVDWPHQSVPAALHRAGYVVVGHEPDSLKRYEVEATPPDDGGVSFPLDDGEYLVSRDIGSLPAAVDIVCTYRPADEQPEIARAAIAAGARAVWIEPDAQSSDEAREVARASGLEFVDGESIAAAVQRLAIRRTR